MSLSLSSSSFQQFAGIHVAMASAPDPTCVPVQMVNSLPAVEQEQEVSNNPTYHTLSGSSTIKCQYQVAFDP